MKRWCVLFIALFVLCTGGAILFLNLSKKEEIKKEEPDIILTSELNMKRCDDFPNIEKELKVKKGIKKISVDLTQVDSETAGTYPIIITYEKNGKMFSKREQLIVLSEKKEEIEVKEKNVADYGDIEGKQLESRQTDEIPVKTGDEENLVLLLIAEVLSGVIITMESMGIYQEKRYKRLRI
ncbi:hypothetical protein M2454_000768 [Aequitasia blattaphilus]|uniref:Ig-like domain-containing protein n=1 Tax=Aequitasia blattaphilus TaxID=2949332 RepID=A0ABT1E816_9FIRM|nr:hypothetical protein [Aequitasia blattaphilus]MCP1101975.1 hypothetical protein [Aequitasia blattaphilus]MCR8614615.1 hypothetical protein [Aequitasia blattaphilus]